MKWFKLDSGFQRDEKLIELKRISGKNGLWLWLCLVSNIAEHYEGDPKETFTIRTSILLRDSFMTARRMHEELLKIASLFNLKVVKNDSSYDISYPKFLLKQQKYYASVQGKFKKVATHIEEEVEVDREVDKENTKRKKKDLSSKILDQFKTICIDLPSPRGLSPSRKLSLKKRSQELTTPEAWEKFFKKVQDSNWLCGRDPKSDGWKAGFDWILKESNFLKILEGNYDNKGEQEDVFEQWAKSERDNNG